MITNKNIAFMFILSVPSLYVHEIGHVVGLWILGIQSSINFKMTALGPVLITNWECAPNDVLGLYFVAFFGPFFASVIFMMLGRFRPEAYVIGTMQLLWAPFEVMSHVLQLGVETVLEMYTLFFFMVFIPLILVSRWSLDKIEEYNKVAGIS